MLGLTGVDDTTQFFQLFDDVFIGVFHVLTLKVSDWVHEFTSVIDRTDNFLVPLNNSGSQTYPVIIFTKIRCLSKYVLVLAKKNKLVQNLDFDEKPCLMICEYF